MMLYKKIFAAAAFLTGMFILEAQAQSISVGPKLGVNFSHVAFSDGNLNERITEEADQKNLIGAQLGVVANIGLNEMISIQPELLYTQKGRRHQGFHRPWNAPYDYKFRRDYLEIPILIKATFGSETLNAFVNGGPYLAYLLGGNENIIVGGNEAEYKLDLKYHHGIKPNRSDVGVAIGGGIGSQIGPGNLALEVRYGLGFSDLRQYQQERDEYYPKQANRNLGVSVYYLIPLQ